MTVTALDEAGNATQLKAQPVIGIWAASDPPGTAPPAFTPSPFNQITPGMTRLDAQVATSSNFLIGISDVRGDGRPDYRYHAHILYADSVFPARVGVNGGVVTVQGSGFAPGLTAKVGSTIAVPYTVGGSRMILAAPAHGDGLQNITISDPVSGASSIMSSALTFGAAASDNLVLLGTGMNPTTPVGTQATNPMPHARTRASGRWGYTRRRRNHRLERQQWRAAFGLRRRLVLHSHQRCEWRGHHLAYTRRSRRCNHYRDPGARSV
jgi:hypothetical protein